MSISQLWTTHLCNLSFRIRKDISQLSISPFQMDHFSHYQRIFFFTKIGFTNNYLKVVPIVPVPVGLGLQWVTRTVDMRHRYSKRPGLQIIRKRRQIFPRLHHRWTSYSPTGPDPGKLFCADHNVFGVGQGFGWRRGELKKKENEE